MIDLFIWRNCSIANIKSFWICSRLKPWWKSFYFFISIALRLPQRDIVRISEVTHIGCAWGKRHNGISSLFLRILIILAYTKDIYLLPETLCETLPPGRAENIPVPRYFLVPKRVTPVNRAFMPNLVSWDKEQSIVVQKWNMSPSRFPRQVTVAAELVPEANALFPCAPKPSSKLGQESSCF